jgi:hypothetical protein
VACGLDGIGGIGFRINIKYRFVAGHFVSQVGTNLGILVFRGFCGLFFPIASTLDSSLKFKRDQRDSNRMEKNRSQVGIYLGNFSKKLVEFCNESQISGRAIKRKQTDKVALLKLKNYGSNHHYHRRPYGVQSRTTGGYQGTLAKPIWPGTKKMA